MSNPLRDSIKDMIDSGIRMSKTSLLTEVVGCNHKAKTIDVMPLGQKGGSSADNGLESSTIIQNISIANSRAIKDESIMPGDYAYIDFIDHTKSKAIVLNVMKRQVYNDVERTGATMLKSLSSQAPPVWAKGGE